ncbi:hypothetical protein Tco_0516771 [Tanacetum coccineum]
MIQYLENARTFINSFEKLSIEQVPRNENKKADALCKIASTSFAYLTKQVLVEVLKEKLIEETEIFAVIEEEGNSWMTLQLEYLTYSTLPAEIKKARSGTESMIPVEIGMPSLRCSKIDQKMNDEALLLNLDILKEKREKAAIQEAKSKAKMEKYYNAKVRSTTFKLGDFVYRNNEASHTKDDKKLSLKWEEPYEVVKALRKGVYKIRNNSGDILPRTWNVKDLKKCYL